MNYESLERLKGVLSVFLSLEENSTHGFFLLMETRDGFKVKNGQEGLTDKLCFRCNLAGINREERQRTIILITH